MNLRRIFNRLFSSGKRHVHLATEGQGVSKGLHLVLCNDSGSFSIYADIIEDRLRAQGHEATIHAVDNKKELFQYLNKLKETGQPVPNVIFLDVLGVGAPAAMEVGDWYEKNYPGMKLPEISFLSLDIDLAAMHAARLVGGDPRFPVAGFVDPEEVDWLSDFMDGDQHGRTPVTSTMRDAINAKLGTDLPTNHNSTRYRRMLASYGVANGVNALPAWRRGVVPPDLAIKEMRSRADDIIAALRQGLYNSDEIKEAGLKPDAKFYGAAGFPVKGKVVFSIKEVNETWTTERPVLVMRSYDPEVVPLLASGKLGGIVVTSTYMASHLKLLCETHMVAGLFGEVPPGVKSPRGEFNEEAKPNLPVFFDGDEVKIGGQVVKKGQTVLVGIDNGICLNPPETLELPTLTLDAVGKNAQLDRDLGTLSELRDCFAAYIKEHEFSVPGVKANIESASPTILNAVGAIGLVRTEQMVTASREQLAALKSAILHHQDAAYDELFSVAKYEYADICKKLNAGTAVKIRLFDFVHQEILSRDEQKRFLELYPKLDMHGGEALETWPKLYEGQVRAIFAALKDAAPGAQTPLEIMMPAVRTEADVRAVKELVDTVAREMGMKPQQYSFGVMVETLEACANIRAIAPLCDFISFGTNDLTQQHFGIARSDLKAHANFARKNGYDPFKKLSPVLLERIERTIAEGRGANPSLRVDVCGAQAADPETAARLHKAGVDNVSVAPSLANLYGLPIQIGYRRYDGPRADAEHHPKP